MVGAGKAGKAGWKKSIPYQLATAAENTRIVPKTKKHTHTHTTVARDKYNNIVEKYMHIFRINGLVY